MPNTMDDDAMFISRPVVITVYFIIMGLCLLGNLVVILIVVFRPVLHNSTSYFLLSMSIADIFVGVVVVSLTLAHKLKLDYAAGFGRMSCVIPPYIELVCVTASVYSLLCVSIDRYRAIVLARKPSRDLYIILHFILVWVGSFLYAAKIFLQDYLTVNSSAHNNQTFLSLEINATLDSILTNQTQASSEDNYSVDTSFCSLLVEEDDADLPYRIADLIVLFIVPTVAMTYFLIQIRHRLWGSTIGVTTNVKKKRAVIRFLTIDLCIFIVCWFPFYSIDIVTDTIKLLSNDDVEVDTSEAYIILRFCFIILALSNSFLNPLIYAFFNKNFISEARQVMSRSKLCHCLVNKVGPAAIEETQASALPDTQIVATT